MDIKTEFIRVALEYTPNSVMTNSLWGEIESAYNHKKRFYHNRTHLESLLQILIPQKQHFTSWNVVVFAIAYHDIVYNVLKSDNEEKSAAVAVDRLKKITTPPELIGICNELILATKKHLDSSSEINLFTDADLSVLGASESVYLDYAANIRKEYSVFPDLIYNPGRKKVLMHFLEMERIFKTDEFFERFEEQARANLELELTTLK